MVLVVHIPKAAGTSFRWALEKYFGKLQVVKDYGPHGSATSAVVQEHLYSGNKLKGPETLIGAISGGSAKVLVGHFPLQRYAEFFKPQNIITFIREPLVRTCSEYLHRVNNETFKGALTDFLNRPGYQNVQSRFLEGLSDNTFVGIAEKFTDSLNIINTENHWNIRVRKKNIGSDGGGGKLAKNLSADELDLFTRMNQTDLYLYENLKHQFDNHRVPTTKKAGFIQFFKNR